MQLNVKKISTNFLKNFTHKIKINSFLFYKNTFVVSANFSNILLFNYDDFIEDLKEFFTFYFDFISLIYTCNFNVFLLLVYVLLGITLDVVRILFKIKSNFYFFVASDRNIYRRVRLRYKRLPIKTRIRVYSFMFAIYVVVLTVIMWYFCA